MVRRGKTPVRGIRIADPLWLASQAAADKRDEDLPDVIREFLERYVKRGAEREEVVVARAIRRYVCEALRFNGDHEAASIAAHWASLIEAGDLPLAPLQPFSPTITPTQETTQC